MAKDNLVAYLKHWESICSRKKVIKRGRKLNFIEEILKDLEFKCHLDEKMPNGMRIEKLIQNFENRWILCEPTELRSINNKKCTTGRINWKV